MKKLICWFKGHTRDEDHSYVKDKRWYIRCKRCGYKLDYASSWCRLVGTEIMFGFTGE